MFLLWLAVYIIYSKTQDLQKVHPKIKKMSLFTHSCVIDQTCMTFFILWNIKEDILKNVLVSLSHVVPYIKDELSKRMQSHHKSLKYSIHMIFEEQIKM